MLPFSVSLCITGILLLITPTIFFFKEGGSDDGDVFSWLASKPLSFIMMVRVCYSIGILFLYIGLAQTYWFFLK
jgi:hypothetical protein